MIPSQLYKKEVGARRRSAQAAAAAAEAGRGAFAGRRLATFGVRPTKRTGATLQDAPRDPCRVLERVTASRRS